ncbi:MAG: hypothetical protein EYC62_03090 [Alphaproteobacteria bacterium]|nr:MAG: hypothetical protein EYC62_03090 [Alphaproteobacteria bacterium]
MTAVPVNTVAVNYTRIGGVAAASAKAHADARERFDIEVKQDLQRKQDKVDALSNKLEQSDSESGSDRVDVTV